MQLSGLFVSFLAKRLGQKTVKCQAVRLFSLLTVNFVLYNRAKVAHRPQKISLIDSASVLPPGVTLSTRRFYG